MFFDDNAKWLDPDVTERPGEWSGSQTPLGNVTYSRADGKEDVTVCIGISKRVSGDNYVQLMILHFREGVDWRSTTAVGTYDAATLKHIANMINIKLEEVIARKAATKPQIAAEPAKDTALEQWGSFYSPPTKPERPISSAPPKVRPPLSLPGHVNGKAVLAPAKAAVGKRPALILPPSPGKRPALVLAPSRPVPVLAPSRPVLTIGPRKPG